MQVRRTALITRLSLAHRQSDYGGREGYMPTAFIALQAAVKRSHTCCHSCSGCEMKKKRRSDLCQNLTARASSLSRPPTVRISAAAVKCPGSSDWAAASLRICWWRLQSQPAAVPLLSASVIDLKHTCWVAELCTQVVGIVRSLARKAPLRSLAVTGGHNLRSQSKNLSQVFLHTSPS